MRRQRRQKHEETGRRQPFVSQREASVETKPTDSLILDFQPPDLWEKIHFCCLSHLACDILLWQPELADTACIAKTCLNYTTVLWISKKICGYLFSLLLHKVPTWYHQLQLLVHNTWEIDHLALYRKYLLIPGLRRTLCLTKHKLCVSPNRDIYCFAV